MNLNPLVGVFWVFPLLISSFSMTSYNAPLESIGLLAVSTTTKAIIEPLIADKVQESPSWRCSCVRTAIKYGLKIPLIDARELIPNSSPVIGGGILFYYPRTKTHHVGVITGIAENYFEIIEGNFKACQIDTRKVYFDDPFVTGFIK